MFLYNGQYGVVTDSNGLYYMRARYYNVDIKRFINQDVVEGNITNSPSLNKYAYCQGNPVSLLDPFGLSPMSQDEGKNFIRDILGFVPGDGSIADIQIQNCIQKVKEGNYWDAAQLLFGLMPMMGDVIGGTNIFGLKGTCTGGKLMHGFGMLGSLGTFGISLKNIYDVSSELSNKHILNKQSWDQDSWMSLSKGLMNVGIALLSAVEFGTSLEGFKGSLCFVAGTLVLTIEGNKAIEEIQAGDLVYSTDPETGESEYKEVVQTFENETEELVHITVADEEIVATPKHPFYVPYKGWTSAIDLRAGDILVLSNGEYVIVEKVQHEILECPVKVYNFEVQDFHTYYVTDTGILVHNASKYVDDGNSVQTDSSNAENSSDVEWTAHNHKHFPSKNTSWKDTVKSTKNGPAKYSPSIPNIEDFERDAWQNGTTVTNGKNWKVNSYDHIIGATEGMETPYVRIENSGNVIHGHLISEREYNKLLK